MTENAECCETMAAFWLARTRILDTCCFECRPEDVAHSVPVDLNHGDEMTQVLRRMDHKVEGTVGRGLASPNLTVGTGNASLVHEMAKVLKKMVLSSRTAARR